MDHSIGPMDFPDIKQEFPDIKQEFIDIKQEPGLNSCLEQSPKKKKPSKPKKLKQEKITDHVVVTKKRKVDRFKGMSEEEVQARLLPDHLAPNLDIVIVGINPGLYAAFVGHHYAGPGNHFWKCLFLSGLIPEQMNASQDYKLLQYGIGFTNIVARTTRGSADLTKKEIKEGGEILREKLLKYKPKIAVFNGKGIYEVFVGHKNFYFGKQPEPLLGTETAVFVMPSSSARCSQLPRAVDKVPFYAALRKYRDHLNGKLPGLEESEITFPDLELKTVKKEVKKEEPEDDYASEFTNMSQHSMEDGLGQFVPGTFGVIPHNLSSTAGEPQGVQSSHFQLPRIKQEPGTEPESGHCSSAYSRKSYENGMSSSANGQMFDLFNTHPNDGGGSQSQPNSFLHGLYGLVNQVASTQSQSKYGVVHQPGQSTSGRPMQFNDALCDIVAEAGDFEFDPITSDEPAAPEPKSKSKKSAAKAPRKRKSKSSPDESQDDPLPSSASTSPSQVASSVSQSQSWPSTSLSSSQPVPSYSHLSSGLAPFTGYPHHPAISQPPFTSMPSLSHSFHALYNPAGYQHPAVSHPHLVPSFSQMMGMTHPYPAHTSQTSHSHYNGGGIMSQNGHMFQPYFHPTLGSSQGFDSYHMNMHIKQEKPEND